VSLGSSRPLTFPFARSFRGLPPASADVQLIGRAWNLWQVLLERQSLLGPHIQRLDFMKSEELHRRLLQRRRSGVSSDASTSVAQGRSQRAAAGRLLLPPRPLSLAGSPISRAPRWSSTGVCSTHRAAAPSRSWTPRSSWHSSFRAWFKRVVAERWVGKGRQRPRRVVKPGWMRTVTALILHPPRSPLSGGKSAVA